MEALVLHEHGSLNNLQLERGWPDPSAHEGSVVIRVKACALNYHDLFTVRGMPGIKVPLPIIPGMDIAGEIVEVGANVAGWSVGDRVLVDPLDRERNLLIGEMFNGGLAEYCEVPAHMLMAIAEEVSFQNAAALPVAYGTAYRMMHTQGMIKQGETILVLGASGGVGNCCVQLARLQGCHVVAAASSDQKLEALRSIGADDGINYAEDEFMKVVHKRYGKPRVFGESGGMDVVVNFTGGDTWVPSIRCVKRGGRLLTCGATAGYDPATDIRYIWSFELSIRGSNGWERTDLESLLGLVGKGAFSPIISRTFDLKSAVEGFARLDNRESFGKVLVLA